MIEYLEQLVADKEYQKALEYGEQLLADPNNDKPELLRIYGQLLEARYRIAEYEGVVALGHSAMKLAEELQDWEAMGETSGLASAAYYRLGNEKAAIGVSMRFLGTRPAHLPPHRYVAQTWYNVALCYRAMGQNEEAARALTTALGIAETLKSERFAHGLRQALIEVSLALPDMKPIPRLLAKCGRYLRQNPNATSWLNSRLFYLGLRISFALATGRFRRAEALARKALREAAGEAYHLGRYHLLLARTLEKQGQTNEAMRQAAIARFHAVSEKRFDLETEVAEYLTYLVETHPESV